MRVRTRVALVAVALVAVAGVVGCVMGRSGESVDFTRLRTADRVEVLGLSNKPLRTISDAETIAALVRFCEAHADDWGVPWYGPPVASLRADFHEGQTFLNDLEVGGDWIGTQHRHFFYSRSVSDADRAEVMKLLDVPDPYAAEQR